MTRTIRLSKDAERDLNQIVDYLAAESPPAAQRLIDASEAALNLLLQMPELGARHAFLDPRLADVRIWSLPAFKSYLIFYRAIADGILVIRVMHASRDWEELLSP